MLFGIFAQRFSHQIGIALYIEEIIHDLKGEAYLSAIIFDGCKFLGICASSQSSKTEADIDQASGFIFVDIEQGLLVDFLVFGFDIHHLTSDQPVYATFLSQLSYKLKPQGFRYFSMGNQLKSTDQQSIGSEQRNSFSKYGMAGFFTAPVFVIVDIRQVVVNQRKGMDHFDGSGDGGYGFRVFLKQSPSQKGQIGSQPFPSVKYAVSDGFMDFFGIFVFAGEIAVQEGLYLRSAAIVDVARNITKSYGDPRFFFEFNEIWPAIISTSRTISYHGSNINDREISGNNLDLIRASNFMCTDLNKSSSAYLELERMNATVVAIGSSIESVDFLPTKTTIFAIREEANGTTDLEFRLIDPDMKTISNEMSERLQGAFAVNVTAHTGLKHLKFQDEECHSLECCDSQ